jgi:solute carrier family 25 protein 39/40
MSALVVSPMELFRTRMQSAEGRNGFQEVWAGVRRMVQQQGAQALWRGLIPTMLRDVPFSAIYWMGYEKIKHNLQERHDLSHFQTSFISGASSGMVIQK